MQTCVSVNTCVQAGWVSCVPLLGALAARRVPDNAATTKGLTPYGAVRQGRGALVRSVEGEPHHQASRTAIPSAAHRKVHAATEGVAQARPRSAGEEQH